MKAVFMKARAKINLNLLVLNKREDNYHNIKSVFQKINMYDEIWIRKTHNNQFTLETNITDLNNANNIVWKAYELMKSKYRLIDGAKVIINKKIPMQAGLGGGSTDCASFLIGMNKLFDLKIEFEDIKEIGSQLGADVVPCLYNTAILAEGIGDVIKPIEANSKYYIIIVKPNLSCDTKEMYKKIDRKGVEIIDTTDDIIKALEKDNIKELKTKCFNSFEYVIENNIINEIEDEFRKTRAITSLMTGSGSCIYGIYDKKQTAKKAYLSLNNKYKTYYCISYNSRRRSNN